MSTNMDELKLNDEMIISKVSFVRGVRVIIDSDLANLYGVSTTRLNEQIKRNKKRFPSDFMFELTQNEWTNLKSQNATSSWGGRRTLPRVFTEHGVIMAASVLNSEIAINASINVVRAFVVLRDFILNNKELSQRLNELEEDLINKIQDHESKLNSIFETLKLILIEEEKPKRKTGFISD